MVGKAVDAPLQPHDFDTIETVINEAQRAEVLTIINVGTSIAESHNSLLIAERFDSVYATIGVHPTDATQSWREDVKQLKAWAAAKEKHKIVAIGETGLDYYHKPYDAQLQKDLFKASIEIALEYDLPLVVHVRDAADDLLEILDEYKHQARGVIHCFQQNLSFAVQVIEWGFLVGIDGPITYPKNQLFRDIVAQIPLSSIILETDAPFLPPQDFRGKLNHPAYIPLFAPTLADLHNISVEDVARLTTANAQRLFNLV